MKCRTNVTRSKIPFLSLLPREHMPRDFFETFFHVCNANTSTKLHFKIMQFLTVTYDMGVLSLR